MRGLNRNPIVISTIAVAVLPFFIWGLQMTFQASLRFGIVMSATSFVIFISLVFYDFVLYKRQSKNQPLRQGQKDKKSVISSDISKDVVSILNKMHKRTLSLAKKTVEQYGKLFNLSDFQDLWGNPAFKTLLMPTHIEIIDNERKRNKRRKLRKDSTKRREQVDDMFEHLKPITEMEWTLEKAIALGNLLDRLPKEQNAKYKGIIHRREKDRHWNRLFKQLNKTKVTYADIFTDKNLEKLINDYIDCSFAGSTLLFIADISKKFIAVDIQPSAFINSGASNPSIAIENRMTQLLEDITNSINELYRNHTQEQNGKRENGESLDKRNKGKSVKITIISAYQPNRPPNKKDHINIDVEFNLKTSALPIKISKIQLWVVNQVLEANSPIMPIDQVIELESYVANFDLDYYLYFKNITSLVEGKCQLWVLGGGHKWISREFGLGILGNPSTLLMRNKPDGFNLVIKQ